MSQSARTRSGSQAHLVLGLAALLLVTFAPSDVTGAATPSRTITVKASATRTATLSKASATRTPTPIATPKVTTRPATFSPAAKLTASRTPISMPTAKKCPVGIGGTDPVEFLADGVANPCIGKQAGKYPVKNIPTSFYQCTKLDGGFMLFSVVECDSDKIFNWSNQTCIKSASRRRAMEALPVISLQKSDFAVMAIECSTVALLLDSADKSDNPQFLANMGAIGTGPPSQKVFDILSWSRNCNRTSGFCKGAMLKTAWTPRLGYVDLGMGGYTIPNVQLGIKVTDSCGNFSANTDISKSGCCRGNMTLPDVLASKVDYVWDLLVDPNSKRRAAINICSFTAAQIVDAFLGCVATDFNAFGSQQSVCQVLTSILGGSYNPGCQLIIDIIRSLFKDKV